MSVMWHLYELYLFTCAVLLHGLFPAQKSDEWIPF